jgi:transcriptional regulator with XRE-family HTH domain
MNKPAHGRGGNKLLDQELGNLVRLRRQELSMTQQDLGAKLGLTFQQIQKYEKGTNRISASRLVQIAEIMRVPLMFFYGPLIEGEKRHDSLLFMDNRYSVRLMQAFSKIRPELQRKAVAMIEALAEAEEIERGGPKRRGGPREPALDGLGQP